MPVLLSKAIFFQDNLEHVQTHMGERSPTTTPARRARSGLVAAGEGGQSAAGAIFTARLGEVASCVFLDSDTHLASRTRERAFSQ